MVAAGGDHSAALSSTGRILSWGYDNRGQCSAVPCLPEDDFFTMVSVGRCHTAGLTSTGRIMCWGDNSFDQCRPVPRLQRDEVFTMVSAGGYHTVGLASTGYILSDGRVLGWGDDGCGQCNDVPTLPCGEVFTMISAGGSHTVGLTSWGRVLGWGKDAQGQCSAVPELPDCVSFTNVAAGGSHTVGVTSQGNVVGWGNNCFGQCSLVPVLTNGEVFAMVSSGEAHTVGVSSVGRALCWGSNGFKQCTGVPGLSQGEVFAMVSAGKNHTLGVTSRGRVLGWGFDQYFKCSAVPDLPDGERFASAVDGTVAVESEQSNAATELPDVLQAFFAFGLGKPMAAELIKFLCKLQRCADTIESQQIKSNRKQSLYFATLAEQAERYDDMAGYMEQVAMQAHELSVQERNIFSIAFKNAVGCRRAAWRIAATAEQKEKSNGSKEMATFAKEYSVKIAAEIQKMCSTIVRLLDENLIPKATDGESKVFFQKMKADYFRYVAEFTHDENNIRATESAREAYQNAEIVAENVLPVTHPIRLGLALNFSVFQYEVLQNRDVACKMARAAVEDAIPELDYVTEESYKDSTLILQLLRDNLALWAADQVGGKG